jgi:hypothetical protein
MSGWTEREEKSVKLIHHSTSSIVEIQVTENVEYKQGSFREETHSTWLDYSSFDDLVKAISKIN